MDLLTKVRTSKGHSGTQHVRSQSLRRGELPAAPQGAATDPSGLISTGSALYSPGLREMGVHQLTCPSSGKMTLTSKNNSKNLQRNLINLNVFFFLLTIILHYKDNMTKGKFLCTYHDIST